MSGACVAPFIASTIGSYYSIMQEGQTVTPLTAHVS